MKNILTLNVLPPALLAPALSLIRERDSEGSAANFIPHVVVLQLLALQARLGIPWRFMPCKSTLLDRRRRWIELGIFADLMRMLMVDPDDVSFVDCTFIECKQPHDDRGWTKIGNGLKIMVICRDDGKIVAVKVACASKAEYKLLRELLDENPGLILQWLVGDSAYDVAANREYCAGRGTHVITTNNWPTRKESLDDPEERAAAKRERNIIERVNAWLKNWRGVATCYCRSAGTYLATLSFAVAAVNGRAS